MKDGTLLWLVNFVKHQASTSPRLVQSLRGLWKRLSSARIRRAVRERYPELFGPGAADVGPGEGVDTVSDRMDALCRGSIKEEEEQEKRPPGEGGCRPPTEDEVRELFKGLRGDVFLFGHEHTGSLTEIDGKYYLNFGTLGNFLEKNVARYGILDIRDGKVSYELKRAEYDDTRARETTERLNDVLQCVTKEKIYRRK